MNFYEVSALWAPTWLTETGGLCSGGHTLLELRPWSETGQRAQMLETQQHFKSMTPLPSPNLVLHYQFSPPRDSDDPGDRAPHQAFPELLSSSLYLRLLMPDGARWQH